MEIKGCGSGKTHKGHIYSDGTKRCPGIPTDHFYEERLTTWPPSEIWVVKVNG
jgi:hypothetical protein